MNYARKNSSKVFGSIAAILVVTAIGIWQFYLFVTFTNADGSVNLDGGRAHLWGAIAMAVLASVAGFFVFSVFLRHDADDELHITS
jgi:predicted exporter